MSERRNDPQMRVVSAEAVEEFKVQTCRLLRRIRPRFQRRAELHHQVRNQCAARLLHGPAAPREPERQGVLLGLPRGQHSAPARRSRKHRRPDLYSEGVRRPQQSLLLLRRRAFARQELQQPGSDLAADRRTSATETSAATPTPPARWCRCTIRSTRTAT